MTELTRGTAELLQQGAAKLAVLGSPISHSKSPAIHRAAYGVLGLDWEYRAIECGEAELRGFLAGRGPEWRGFSVTMPLKAEAAKLAAVVDPVAERSGVVNTLLRLTSGAAGEPQWAGFNTDVAGLAQALSRAGLDASHTVVLGAGATAMSAVLAAEWIGAERITIAARRREAAVALAERVRTRGTHALGDAKRAPAQLAAASLGERITGGVTLVIGTLPGPAGAAAPLSDSLFAAPLFDVAYDPWPSPLAERWRSAGCEAHAGLEMLIEQALVQLRIFVNGAPDAPLDGEAAVLAAMRAASVEG